MPYMTRTRSGAVRRKNYRSIAGLPATRRRVAKPRVSKPAAQVVRKIVKSEISRRAEDKMVSIITAKTHNSGISGSADFYQLVGNIGLGSDSHQRNGDRVTPKRLKVQFKLTLDSSHYTGQTTYTTPIQARVLIVKQKTIKNWGNIGTIDTAHLLKTNEGGTSAERQYTGDTNDNMRMINTDLFEVLLDKKIMFKPQFVQPSSSDTGIMYPVLPNTYTFTKYLRVPARLTFDDGNTVNPNNFCPVATVGYCYPYGASPDVVNTQIQMTVLSTLYYEDS